MASRAAWWRLVLGIVLFGTSFGYVEAAVVAYLRSIYVPLHLHYSQGEPSDDLFPLLTLDQLQEAGPEHLPRLKTELAREFATLLMLAGGALMAGRNLREWTAIFFTSFGVWDITFYLSLKALLGWPASLLTWDLLFLLPAPWVGPVIAPVVVAASMIVLGLAMLWREYGGDPVRFGRARLLASFFGGLLVFLSFIADVANTTRGGYPGPFHWGLFVVGEMIWLVAIFGAFRRRV
jgi:hypothetical protein